VERATECQGCRREIARRIALDSERSAEDGDGMRTPGHYVLPEWAVTEESLAVAFICGAESVTVLDRHGRESCRYEKTKGHTHHGAALPVPDPEINREETPALSQITHYNTTGADDEGTCYD
jgi:hypothetical protein